MATGTTIADRSISFKNGKEEEEEQDADFLDDDRNADDTIDRLLLPLLPPTPFLPPTRRLVVHVSVIFTSKDVSELELVIVIIVFGLSLSLLLLLLLWLWFVWFFPSWISSSAVLRRWRKKELFRFKNDVFKISLSPIVT